MERWTDRILAVLTEVTSVDITGSSKRASWRITNLVNIIPIFRNLTTQDITRRGHIFRKDFRRDKVSSTSMTLSSQRHATSTNSLSLLHQCRRHQLRCLNLQMESARIACGGEMMALRVRTGLTTTTSQERSKKDQVPKQRPNKKRNIMTKKRRHRKKMWCSHHPFNSSLGETIGLMKIRI